MSSDTARETALVALVAASFAVGFALVGLATAPLAPAGAGFSSRGLVVAAIPPVPSPPPAAAGVDQFGGGKAREPASDAGSLSPDSLARITADLRRRRLALPVEGIEPGTLRDSFDDPRAEGRFHRAIDIMAPRGTPVFAVEDGTIAELGDSQGGGGIVVYQYDPGRTYVYYYAHLEKWADGLAEGDRVGRGQVIGYVGSTGNAHADAPHVHFAILLVGPEGRWWEGIPLNPYPLWARR